MSENNPKIPAQRGFAKIVTAKKTSKVVKAPVTFRPEYVNDSLELSGPKNSRPGKLSQYTQDLLVYVAALEKEVIGLREKQSSLDAKITELNGTVTALEQRITANSEKYQLDLAKAKSNTRAANATMDSQRTRADIAEMHEDIRQQVHNLFDGAPLGNLAISRGTENGSHAGASFYSCGGLHFVHSVNSQRRSLTVKSASDNPIKLREYVVTHFSGNDLLINDKTYLQFLREAATVEGYELNKKRLKAKELERVYDLEELNKVFGCSHTVVQHIKMREELLLRFTPAIVTMMFQRLEGTGSSNDHQIELTRAFLVSGGMNESAVNAWAKDRAKDTAVLEQAKQKLRSEGYDWDLARTLGGPAVASSIDPEALDLRPRDLRIKHTSASDALHLIQDQSNPLHHGAPGLYGTIQPLIREYNPDLKFSDDPYGEKLQAFPKGDTHDLGTDSLYDLPNHQGYVSERVNEVKTLEHSGECRNNGFTNLCPHPDHRPKG